MTTFVFLVIELFQRISFWSLPRLFSVLPKLLCSMVMSVRYGLSGLQPPHPLSPVSPLQVSTSNYCSSDFAPGVVAGMVQYCTYGGRTDDSP